MGQLEREMREQPAALEHLLGGQVSAAPAIAAPYTAANWAT